MVSCDRITVQVLELRGHPYYVGVQFHPEFKSRPGKPSAVFLGEGVLSLFLIIVESSMDQIGQCSTTPTYFENIVSYEM